MATAVERHGEGVAGMKTLGQVTYPQGESPRPPPTNPSTRGLYARGAMVGAMAFNLSEQEIRALQKRYPELSPEAIRLLMEAMPATLKMLD